MTILLNTIPLSPELVWVDEFAWNQTRFATKFTLGKAVIIKSTQVKGNSGRPMTLQSEYAWMQRTDILKIQDLLDNNSEPLLITLHDGRQFQVVPVNDGFKATPLQENPEPDNNSWYSVIFNFAIIN